MQIFSQQSKLKKALGLGRVRVYLPSSRSRSLLLIHSRHIKQLARQVFQFCSRKACLLEQEEEGALLLGCGRLQRSFFKLTTIPELKPFEIVRAIVEVILVSARLEEEVFISPERGNCLGAGYDVAAQHFVTTELRRLIISKDLED